MSTAAWYVLQSKSHKENQVYSYLRSQGHEVFYPTLTTRSAKRPGTRVRPYFPRYMFVHADLEEVGISCLKWLPGAIGIVQFDGVAASVPESFIYHLKRRLDEIEAAGGLTFDGLKPGDPIRITAGPFAGYEAIFDSRLSGEERVLVLFEMLGRLVRVQLSASAIEKRPM